MKKIAISTTIITIISMALILLTTLLAVSKNDAHADLSRLTVEQPSAENVVYCGQSYIDEIGHFSDMGTGIDNNPLYESLRFYLDGDLIAVDAEHITFSSLSFAEYPDSYTSPASVEYMGEVFDANITFEINKRPLIVQALVNGQTSATVREGEKYITSVSYGGFVGSDNERTLTAPAIITKEPKLPTVGYSIVAEYAQSDRYEFVYKAAKIVITENPETTKTIMAGDEEVVVLTGKFSPYYTLEYLGIGINKTSPDYVSVEEKYERYYGNGSLGDKYKKSDAFRLNLMLDGEEVEQDQAMTVSIKLDEKLTGKKEYMLIQFASDGSNNIISASEEDGYLIFTTVGLGEYVLLTPIEGANTTIIIAVVASIVVVALLGIVFGSLFRRKY